jgi:hypothetical protein
MPKRATEGNTSSPPKKKGKIDKVLPPQSGEAQATDGSVQDVVGSSAKSPPRTPEKKHPAARPTPPSPVYVPYSPRRDGHVSTPVKVRPQRNPDGTPISPTTLFWEGIRKRQRDGCI